MNWPNHADYAEAIQNPELCFELPELHTGEVATTPLGLPRALSGNFATVYELNGGGERHAVRCFVRQVTNQQDRYAALARHLDGLALDCMVPFEFVSRGIRVHERWFPIVKMQWVDGVPLHTHLEQHLDSPEQLAWLAADWRELMAGLKRHRIGHGDLQHGNILVTPDGDLKLVDYDGVYVPVFARERSPELGHANYQHPLRAPEFYDERLDHFPELLIYLSLRALTAEPALWDEYFNGDNLIATAVDLRVPQCSTLWPHLLQSPDHDVRKLTVVLVECLKRVPADVPCLETILTEWLPHVEVPAALEFTAAPVAPPTADMPPTPESETNAELEVLVRLPSGPLAAVCVTRPAGTRPAAAVPHWVDLFGWSALVTALLALVPPLHFVAGLSALILALLACVMPGRVWQTARIAAVLAAALGTAAVWMDHSLKASARLQEVNDPVSSKTAPDVDASQTVPTDLETDTATAERTEPAPVARSVPLLAPRVATPNVTRPEATFTSTEVQRWRPHSETVSSLAISSDGRHVLSASTDRSLAVWNIAAGRPEYLRTNLTEPLIALTSLSNVSIVVSLDAMHQLQWWSLDGGVPMKSSRLDPDSVISPAISRDGQWLAVGGKDRRQVRLLHATTSAPLLPRLSSWANLARFSPDASRLALAGHDDTIQLLALPAGTARRALEFPDAGIKDLEFSPDGSQLWALGERGQLRIWSTIDGELLADERLGASRAVAAWVAGRAAPAVLMAAERRLFYVSTKPATVATAELRTEQAVTALASLPAGDGLVTGHQDGTIMVWRLDSPVAGTVKFARP